MQQYIFMHRKTDNIKKLFTFTFIIVPCYFFPLFPLACLLAHLLSLALALPPSLFYSNINKKIKHIAFAFLPIFLFDMNKQD